MNQELKNKTTIHSYIKFKKKKIKEYFKLILLFSLYSNCQVQHPHDPTFPHPTWQQLARVKFIELHSTCQSSLSKAS